MRERHELFVAGTSGKTLVEQWNRARWSIVESPDPSATGSRLTGVTCSSRTHCFAIGSSNSPSWSRHWSYADDVTDHESSVPQSRDASRRGSGHDHHGCVCRGSRVQRTLRPEAAARHPPESTRATNKSEAPPGRGRATHGRRVHRRVEASSGAHSEDRESRGLAAPGRRRRGRCCLRGSRRVRNHTAGGDLPVPYPGGDRAGPLGAADRPSDRATDRWDLRFSGGAPYAIQSIATAPVQRYTEALAGPAMFRDSTRRAPHNFYREVLTSSLRARDASGPPNRCSRTVAAHSPPAGGNRVTDVVVGFKNGYATSWHWDARTGTWLRSIFGHPDIAASGHRSGLRMSRSCRSTTPTNWVALAATSGRRRTSPVLATSSYSRAGTQLPASGRDRFVVDP